MSSYEIPRDHHLARYCAPTKSPDKSLFMPRTETNPPDVCLSWNWLELFDQGERQQELDMIRDTFDKRTLKPDGKFVVFRIGEVVDIMADATGCEITARFKPVVGNVSHAGLCGYDLSDQSLLADMADEIAESVSDSHVFRVGPD